MKRTLLLFLILPIFTSNATATLHEWDLAGAPQVFNNEIDSIRPDRTVYAHGSRGNPTIKTLLVKNGEPHELAGLDFQLSTNCAKNPDSDFEGIARLETNHYKIQNQNGRVYEVRFSGKCSSTNTLMFIHDSQNGQGMGVHDILHTAISKFSAIERADFWSRKLKVIWPGPGDYYSWGTLNVTKGHYWDVVGHELGHAIYDMADIGRMGGGSHRIDECYNKTLALSEGWASFFSAWLKVSLDDPDAKFEYMVARRAPLEIEHVPSDVCKGPTNEWRVYSFLWDLIDRHVDGESMDEMFASIWDHTIKQNFRSITELKDHLEGKFDPVLLNVIYKQNILGE